MESEGQLQPNTVDDATRLAASARTFTLQPISDEVAPEEESDESVVAHHILAPPIANIPSDEEKTSPSAAQVAVATKNHRRALTVSVSVVVLLTAGTAYLMLTK